MAQIEGERKFRSDPVRAVNLQKKIAKEGSHQDAHGKTPDSNAGRQQNTSQNNEQVVDERRERRHDELSLRILHGTENASLVKTKLRWQHQAREENDMLFFDGTETRRDDGNKLRRENLRDTDKDGDEKAHERHHRGKNAPAFVLLIRSGEFRENGNERDAEGAGGH